MLSALPMLDRVDLVMGDFDVLGGEWGADWPGNTKQKTSSYH